MIHGESRTSGESKREKDPGVGASATAGPKAQEEGAEPPQVDAGSASPPLLLDHGDRGPVETLV